VTRFSWTDQAKSELRQIDREHALQILEALTHYSKTGQGDIKRLKASSDLRLRVGDYRVRFEIHPENILRVLHVKHRREAYL
jgi:mRNA-degrading endonuclease RelE of RelBE toxin-antitoxin system